MSEIKLVVFFVILLVSILCIFTQHTEQMVTMLQKIEAVPCVH
jgi:hypothetical protein